MKTVPSTKQSIPIVKQAVIALQQPPPRQLKHGQYHTYKLHTIPTDATFWPGLQAVLKGQNVMQGPPSYTVAKTLLKGDTLTLFKQAENTHGNQTLQNF
eukprot:10023802-Ditylum_brightwellii.AAC.1